VSDALFIPITCPTCQRTSAFALPLAGLEQKLAAQAHIGLQCAFDGFKWQATPVELAHIRRLMYENAVVSASSWLRLREPPRGPAFA
jgi:hypothetical protein